MECEKGTLHRYFVDSKLLSSSTSLRFYREADLTSEVLCILEFANVDNPQGIAFRIDEEASTENFWKLAQGSKSRLRNFEALLPEADFDEKSEGFVAKQQDAIPTLHRLQANVIGWRPKLTPRGWVKELC